MLWKRFPNKMIENWGQCRMVAFAVGGKAERPKRWSGLPSGTVKNASKDAVPFHCWGKMLIYASASVVFSIIFGIFRVLTSHLCQVRRVSFTHFFVSGEPIYFCSSVFHPSQFIIPLFRHGATGLGEEPACWGRVTLFEHPSSLCIPLLRRCTACGEA